jgi:hypothetical protein
MGVFEMEKFAKGTNDVAKTLAECTSKGAITVSLPYVCMSPMCVFVCVCVRAPPPPPSERCAQRVGRICP